MVAETEDGDAAITAVDEHRPDVVLMDVRMPGRDGLSATCETLDQPLPPGVLVLTTFDSDDLVLGALHAGALGFERRHRESPHRQPIRQAGAR
ncbi:response regulator [Actinophytocola glycyrrhizae]|uniref:Response regulator transcription factor n=1 Tax=Actinophytocola glycyrrhizae TaxID=2044873 RepID=A0ABV9S9G0_9PSEU